MAVSREGEKPGNSIERLAFIFYGILAAVAIILPYIFGKNENVLLLARGSKPLEEQAMAGILVGFALVMISRVSIFFFKIAAELERNLANILGPIEVWEAFTLALLSGFSEELFFRVTLLYFLGPVASTIIFGLCHIGPGKPFRFWTVSALLAGGILALMMESGLGFLSVFLAHATTNAFNLWRLGKIRRETGPQR